MRVFVSVLTALTGFAIGAPGALAASHKLSAKCPPRPERVIAADAQALVYVAPGPPAGARTIFGCAYTSKRSYQLGPASSGSSSGSEGTYPIVLAGAVVAYDVGQSHMLPLPNGHSMYEVWVRNLATGKVIHRMPNGSPAEPGDVGLGETTALVVKSDGSVAWIVRAPGELGGIQVRSFDMTGSHLLAASPEIEPQSLALAGSTLYWTQGGKALSAQLQ